MVNHMSNRSFVSYKYVLRPLLFVKIVRVWTAICTERQVPATGVGSRGLGALPPPTATYRPRGRHFVSLSNGILSLETWNFLGPPAQTLKSAKFLGVGARKSTRFPAEKSTKVSAPEPSYFLQCSICSSGYPNWCFQWSLLAQGSLWTLQKRLYC